MEEYLLHNKSWGKKKKPQGIAASKRAFDFLYRRHQERKRLHGEALRERNAVLPLTPSMPRPPPPPRKENVDPAQLSPKGEWIRETLLIDSPNEKEGRVSVIRIPPTPAELIPLLGDD